MKHALIALALVTSAAHAEFYTGNDLHNWLQSTNSTDRTMALGYIAGVADAGQGSAHCIPGTVQLGQLRDMVRNVLNQAPTVRHQFTADQFVSFSLSETWPCQKKETY